MRVVRRVVETHFLLFVMKDPLMAERNASPFSPRPSKSESVFADLACDGVFGQSSMRGNSLLFFHRPPRQVGEVGMTGDRAEELAEPFFLAELAQQVGRKRPRQGFMASRAPNRSVRANAEASPERLFVRKRCRVHSRHAAIKIIGAARCPAARKAAARIRSMPKTRQGEAGGFQPCQIWDSGGPDRIRTCDLLIKSQLLYQLSYGPVRNSRYGQGREMSNEQRIQRNHVVPNDLFTCA